MSTDPATLPCSEFAGELAATRTLWDAEKVIDQWTGSFALREEPPLRATPPSNKSSDSIVGVWVRTIIDGETWFVRGGISDYLWANVEKIAPKRASQRIVLIGESAARGYPLDPLFNCAAALTAYLNSASAETTEIVDLARNGITPSHLLQLAKSAKQLEPDLYIVFAGNNWGVLADSLDYKEIAQLIKTSRDWSAVRNYFRRVVKKQVGSWVASLAGEFRAQGVHAIFVLPANNLRDWRVDSSASNPLLSSEQHNARDLLLRTAQDLYKARSFDEAEKVAGRLLDIEEGVSVGALQILARCAFAKGATDKAARLFEEAADAGLALPTGRNVLGEEGNRWLNWYSVKTAEIRASVNKEGMGLVDLPKVFAEANGGTAPGRELFVDRVHMTGLGIQTAMAAVSAAVLRVLNRPVPTFQIPVPGLHIEPRAEAQAHLVAAITNAAHGQDEDVVQYHCNRAAQSTPEILDAMRHYLELRVNRSPDVFCKSLYDLRLLQPRFPVIRYLGYSTTRIQKPQPSFMLMRNLAQTMAKSRPEALAESEALIRREHAVNHRCLDLLDPKSGAAPLRSYFVSYSRENHFSIVCEKQPPELSVRITSRVRHIPAAGKTVALRVNDLPIHSWPSSLKWNSVEFPINAACLKDGLNTLVIEWPDPEQSREHQIERVTRLCYNTLREGSRYVDDIYIVYGELHAFALSARQ